MESHGISESQKRTSPVFVDLKKVFDTVNHSILLKKLDYYEIRGIANKGFLRIVFVRYRSICLN